MTVELSSLTLTDGSKSTNIDTTTHLAILDSGTSLIVLPTSVADIFVKQMGGVTLGRSSFVNCNVESATATFDFQFGGPKGPKISVPVKEMVNPRVENAAFDDGTPACRLGISTQNDADYLVLGDVFLRSAYVVYNLESRTVGLAMAKFNVTDSNIKAISASMGNDAIPGAETGGTSVAYSATATASDILGPGFGGAFSTADASTAISILAGTPSFAVGGGSQGGESTSGANSMYASPRGFSLWYVFGVGATVVGMMVGGVAIRML